MPLAVFAPVKIKTYRVLSAVRELKMSTLERTWEDAVLHYCESCTTLHRSTRIREDLTEGARKTTPMLCTFEPPTP